MMRSKIDGLMVVKALQRSSLIETSIPTHEIAAAVLAGMIVMVKGAFDSHEMRRLRAAIISANIPLSEPTFSSTNSWRNRREEKVGAEIEILYETSFFAVKNPEDEIGRAISSTAERLASYWRTLTGDTHTFIPEADRRALRPMVQYYPAGGGCFGWHAHKLEPTKIGMILALSEMGVDFVTGGTEFQTPFGVINSAPQHNIGDVCLFRYDMRHRVAPIEPDRERRWGGSGRWTVIIPVDSRPLENMTA